MLVETGTRPVGTGLVGGRLCLDFVNTIHDYRSSVPRDDLLNYSDLITWSRQANILDDTEQRQLNREAQQRSAEALAAMERAKRLRAGLYRLFLTVAEGKRANREDLADLNEALSVTLVRSQLVSQADRFVWSWSTNDARLDRVLWPVVRSAADLLTSDDLSRLRQCEGTNCTWFFIDTSKNHSRRWCEMKVCGNRVKARRHYERSRSRAANRRKTDNCKNP